VEVAAAVGDGVLQVLCGVVTHQAGRRHVRFGTWPPPTSSDQDIKHKAAVSKAVKLHAASYDFARSDRDRQR
jgi:hypothetical protein